MTMTPEAKAQKARTAQLGAKGIAIDEKTLRMPTLIFLAKGGTPSAAMPVTITWYPDDTRGITDGRHRIFYARKCGLKTIRMKVQGMGPRGGINWTAWGDLPV